ncbi:MAG: gst [Caulobacteraceae bacterium]|jgi:glutathione S-transferase|nr:gst [Caulobacteraceae bacterium]
MLTLYSAPRTCALASHIALEQAGAHYEVVRLDFRANAQREPDYLAINPKGRVPALVTERGVITETPAILTFIAQSHPQARLAPLDDAFAFAQVQAFASFLCATVHPAHAHGVRGYRWADDPAAIEEMKRKAPQVMSDCFDLIERDMLAGPWVMGEAYSFCDPYLFTIAGWLEGHRLDIARWPKTADHFDRMSENPAVRRVLASHTAPV